MKAAPTALPVVFRSGSDLNGLTMWRTIGLPAYRAVVERHAHDDPTTMTASALLDTATELISAGAEYYTFVQALIPSRRPPRSPSRSCTGPWCGTPVGRPRWPCCWAPSRSRSARSGRSTRWRRGAEGIRRWSRRSSTGAGCLGRGGPGSMNCCASTWTASDT
ncbi:hypothetical protein [Tessaracoccus coleopterorum]|uniref:hypothetical protein n=1 Tax=Tessaracoccus coleopterorum TaxID=2714950 RepID=UPI001E3F5BC4|nr:hypothetical protein [Tessaracoccus coleopterorum]